MKRAVEPQSTYFNADGVEVKVYAEKNVKRRAWMRGEAFMGMKMRTEQDTGGMLVPFSRKNGKY
jgi:hypothetical protein